jgi:hypothetical protein
MLEAEQAASLFTRIRIPLIPTDYRLPTVDYRLLITLQHNLLADELRGQHTDPLHSRG